MALDLHEVFQLDGVLAENDKLNQRSRLWSLLVVHIVLLKGTPRAWKQKAGCLKRGAYESISFEQCFILQLHWSE